LKACSDSREAHVQPSPPKARPAAKSSARRGTCAERGGALVPGPFWMEPGLWPLGAKKVHLLCSAVFRDAPMACVARAGYRAGAVVWEARSGTGWGLNLQRI
jgi:hypothetical protein